MAATSGILGERNSVILVYIHHLECWQARSMSFQITAAVYSQKGDYFLDITAFCAVFERTGMTVCTKKSAVVFASLCLWVCLFTPSLFFFNYFHSNFPNYSKGMEFKDASVFISALQRIVDCV